jgi:ribose transport system ATP-binding protein
MSEPDLLLRLEGVTKVYGRQKALDDVTFDLRAGEVHCLVGENGAGKSTLIKILSGAVRPDAGSLHVMGGDFHTLDPRQAMALGIATIYQDVELIDSLTVADNIFLGCERTGALPGVVDARRQFAAARDIMDTLGIDIDERALVEDLPAAKQQMLQIVKALHGEAKVLIMDEPTSSLGLQETKALMQLVKDLRARGVGVIYISHYIEEVFELGDRITVLKDGQVAGTHDVADVDHDTVVRQMVGREASAFFARRRVELGEVQFEVRGLSYGDAVRDVSFSVRCGEIFGIGGMVGSGRSELMHLIFGAARPQAGSVLLGGADVTAGSPKQAMRSGICLVTEDRKASALLAGRSVLENVMVVSNELFGGPVLGIRRERRTVDGMVERLGIAVADREQDVLSLSGGNQQKAVVARWLLSEAKVFLFDEPTKGVDIGAKEQIYELMVELAEAGKSVVMISSDMPELLSMSDRIGVMRAGRLTHVLPAEDVNEEMLIQCFLGPG